jgi:hypothetical protein
MAKPGCCGVGSGWMVLIFDPSDLLVRGGKDHKKDSDGTEISLLAEEEFHKKRHTARNRWIAPTR